MPAGLDKDLRKPPRRGQQEVVRSMVEQTVQAQVTGGCCTAPDDCGHVRGQVQVFKEKLDYIDFLTTCFLVFKRMHSPNNTSA